MTVNGFDFEKSKAKLEELTKKAIEDVKKLTENLIKELEQLKKNTQVQSEKTSTDLKSDPVDEYFESDEYIEAIESAEEINPETMTFDEFLDSIYTYDKTGKVFDFDKDFKAWFTELYIYSDPMTIDAIKHAICLKKITYHNIFEQLKGYYPELTETEMKNVMKKDFETWTEHWYIYTGVDSKTYYPYKGPISVIKYLVKKIRLI